MILQLVFCICTAIMVLCIVCAVRSKVHNIGFIIMTTCVAACDFICFRLLICKNVTDARNIITIFYSCQTLFYLGLIWMVMAISRRKKYFIFCIPTALISVIQIYIMISNLVGKRIMTLSRHLLFGGAWWVAENGKNRSNSNVLFSFQGFRILVFVNIVLIFIAMIVSCSHSAKIFRSRYYALIVANVILTGVEVVTSRLGLPVWIVCFVMNILCLFSLYYTCFYANRKLSDWSLTRFANEMSDGFLLYNEQGDLILVNDLLKHAFPPLIIKSFEFQENIDEWIADTVMVDDMAVRKFEIDGKDYYYKSKRIDLTDYDADIGTIYILHDTTESILKMYAMEEANIELERAAKMKSDFLANMSHEIRTPMNAVIGMAEIALREELPPNVSDYIMQIQNSGRNLLNIINDILDFSKIEAGKMEIIPERYEPLSEINDIANVLATRIGDKRLELFVICDDKIPHALEGDVMRIRQVLINLANNAIKFTKEGMVLVKISVEELSDDMINLFFHVIDTGQGIKDDDLGKLFQSFQQVDSKRNRSVEGTGLGLAISQKLCEAMGGSIGVTSEYGKGSDFYFKIPQKVLDPARDIVVDDAGKKHAFVINENPEMLGMFIEEMNKLGVDGHVIPSLSKFEPVEGKNYLFFEETAYDDEIKEYLDSHRDITGVILVDYDSIFEADRDNLRIMRRPETTLAMVMILNDRELGHRISETATSFKIDFTAPNAKILIVDDNAINITIAEGLLKPIRAKCFSANSGKEAIEKVADEDFDIILMDHMMPEMDGVETTKVIRSTIERAADTPIIALTANAMEGVKEMFLNEGMNDFVPKPIEIRNLVAKLIQWLPDDKIIKGRVSEDVDEQEGISESDETEIIKYDGLDYDKAVAALGSNGLYQTIVKEYYRSGDSRYRDISDAYDRKDWQDYTIKVHALKSSSRQIGAFELGDMAEELENAGKALDMDIIDKKTGETLKVFKELIDNLSQYFAEEEAQSGDLPELSEEVRDTLIERLLSACDDLDMDEMEAVEAELKKYSYSDEISGVIKDLCDAIENIDVDRCTELAGQLKN